MNDKALYLQIVDAVCERILEESLHQGDRLPSVREYAATVQVNANTVMRAYETLSNLGIITNRRGIGYFVSDDAPQIVRKKSTEDIFSNDLVQIFRRLALLKITPDELAGFYQFYLDDIKPKK